MRFDDLARESAKAVHEQVEAHPLPGMERRGSPLRRLVIALGAAVLVTGAVLGVTGLLGGDGIETIDQPSTTVAPPPTSTTTISSVPTLAGEGGEWLQVPHDPEVFAPAQISAITSHNGILVAVGFEANSDTFAGRPVALRSANGVEWERFELDEENAVFFDVASSGDLLVAVGWSDFSGAVWTSTDGESWVRASATEGVFNKALNTQITAITPFGGGFVAVGSETLIDLADPLEGGYEDDAFGRAVVWQSPDGYSWTRIEDTAFGGSGFTQMVDIATNGESLVAVGRTSLSETRTVPKAWYSEDGRFWQSAPIDDDSETSFMTTVTSDGEFYWAAGRDYSTDMGVRWGGGGGSWEREGAIADKPSNLEPGAYLITEQGRIIVGRFSGSVWFISPTDTDPFSRPGWQEFTLDPPVNDPVFGDAVWVGDRVVIVGSHRSSSDQANRAAVWHWFPPEPSVLPTIEVPDPGGPLCSATEQILLESDLWDRVAATLFEQERERRGLGPENQPVHIQSITQDGWIAIVAWFDRTPGDLTLWVGKPIEDGWSLTPVWGRFGGSAEEILGAIDAAFPDAPPGLLCIDTEAFRTQ